MGQESEKTSYQETEPNGVGYYTLCVTDGSLSSGAEAVRRKPESGPGDLRRMVPGRYTGRAQPAKPLIDMVAVGRPSIFLWSS